MPHWAMFVWSNDNTMFFFLIPFLTFYRSDDNGLYCSDILSRVIYGVSFVRAQEYLVF